MANTRLMVRNMLRFASLTTGVTGIEIAAMTGRSNAAKKAAGMAKVRTLSIINQFQHLIDHELSNPMQSNV